MGVHTFEIWNEPNYAQFWPSAPNAAEYVTMLKAGYAAVKTADPGATVLMGGLSPTTGATSSRSTLPAVAVTSTR